MERLYDSPKVSIESALRREGVDDLLVMDWWFDGEGMNKQERSDVSQLIAREFAKESGALHKKLDAIAATQAPKGTPANYWRNTAGITLGAVVATALLTWAITAWQMRTSRDDELSRLKIGEIVDGKLAPIIKDIQQLREDVAKIKGADGVAQIPPSGTSLRAFAGMDQPQFSQNLARIADSVSAAKKSGKIEDIATLDAIQKKIASVPLNSAEALRATFAVISYASFVREKTGLFPNAPLVRRRSCNFLAGPDIHLSNVTFTGCGQIIDGLHLKDSTFVNSIITYNGGPLDMQNVTFINCLFVISQPASGTLTGRTFANQVLVNNIGQEPKFTATVG